MIILALIVIIACLKTAVGLMSAFSETFVELFPKMVVIYLGLATAVTMKIIDLTKNQEIQLLSQLLIEE